MNIGDIVRVSSLDNRYENSGSVWHEFAGKSCIILSQAKRLHIPAFKVLIDGKILEFDFDELELIDEDR